MVKENDKTRIQVSKETLERLRETIKKKYTYDEFINHVLDEMEGKE
jgi:hypothetical protein